MVRSVDRNMKSASFGLKSFVLRPHIVQKRVVKCATIRLRFRRVHVKPVPNPAHAQNMFGIVWIIFEFFAERGHVRVDYPMRDVNIFTPKLVEKLIEEKVI